MLPVLTFSSLLNQMAARLQGSAGPLIDLTIGSVLRAVLESCASVVLWLQWLVLQVLATTRAATCVGSDLDSWMADFTFFRLPGSEARGDIVFARYTIGVAASVPVGTAVITSDGTQSFKVIEDATNPAWDGIGGYTLPAVEVAVSVPAQCTSAGAIGNVQAGTVSLIQSPIVGIDTVNNPAAFSGGAVAETDTDFRARFALFINSRSLATVLAIRNAISSVQVGLRSAVVENVNMLFGDAPGSFLVIVDDGSGNPPSALLSNVQIAVEAVRPIGTVFAVQRPIMVLAAVSMTLETSDVLTHAFVAAGIQQAVVTWIAGLPIAGTLSISKLDAIAHAFDSSVLSVTSTLINGTASDVVAPINGVILTGSVTVS